MFSIWHIYPQAVSIVVGVPRIINQACRQRANECRKGDNELQQDCQYRSSWIYIQHVKSAFCALKFSQNSYFSQKVIMVVRGFLLPLSDLKTD